MGIGAMTISETIQEIRTALRDYIEATYHVGSSSLIRQRRKLLDDVGVVYQVPYIESTPRYWSGSPFAELGLPTAALELFELMAHPPNNEPALLHDPPYRHQAKALSLALNEKRSFAVTTGTGSGKTEAFLLPMLGKLAIEAKERPTKFGTPAVRTILLYPMNALVNDQLGRLRLMLGNRNVVQQFMAWAGRPARFARYTSRTLYPGVRKAEKDQVRLRAIGKFYVDLLLKAASTASPEQQSAQALIDSLRMRGKWPAKPDLQAWYGASGSRWKNSQGEFVRAVTLPGDSELLTRHEVLKCPPDVLVTNYSMLEYMLMRPLERPIFDATRSWLDSNPDESFLLVVDEAHLYRGAAGAEVGLLIRRLRARLGIPPDRLQVICTSASFNTADNARSFASQLSGKRQEDFEPVSGELALRPGPRQGSEADARLLASIALDDFYAAETEQARLQAIAPFLQFRNVTVRNSVATALFAALENYPPMSLLVNRTMSEAIPLGELGSIVFQTDQSALADGALTTLIAFGSLARKVENEPGLLPCRIHSFFRGLPGLWACVDPDCSARSNEVGSGPTGRLYGQPRDTCECGARVFELYTCRQCGSAYARAYTNNVEQPTYLWSEPGGAFTSSSGFVEELEPLDLCLEEPEGMGVEAADLDLVTGRLNPIELGDRTRQVFLVRDRKLRPASKEFIRESAKPGEFRPCGVCGRSAAYGRSSVQDHQTKGDEPFRALITRQIQVQPPGKQSYSDFAPLRGRKVLTFSDSRQQAARLAPNLQKYSMQDVLRPLVLTGFTELQSVKAFAPRLCLDDLFLAVLLAAAKLEVRLRPELRPGETLRAQNEVEYVVRHGDPNDPEVLMDLLMSVRGEVPPNSLLRGMVTTLTDRYYGLQSLALASLVERGALRAQLVDALPDLATLATTPEQKVALVRIWLNQWTDPGPGIWFSGMPLEWWQAPDGVEGHSGKFASFLRWLPDAQVRREFERAWLPVLLRTFCEPAGGKHRMRAAALSLSAETGWGYCQICKVTQRPYPGSSRCTSCARESVALIDPEHDPVFSARKAYYRGSTVRALATPAVRPTAVIASEHTAQLNAAQADEIFSKAEEHELLFQDVDLGIDEMGRPHTAIDVLSCTTTMEVGIDIGTLSGVALRNMPPSRASYQQRSGRAGRRGNAVATVIAFGSVDSHDEHYFREPDGMIRGRVEDPSLTLDNVEIARRHVTAFLLQRYHQARLPEIEPEAQPQLFAVLGTVNEFKNPASLLSREDFANWLRLENEHLVAEADSWLPAELSHDDRRKLLSGLVTETLREVDAAIEYVVPPEAAEGGTPEADQGGSESQEVQPEPGEETQNPRAAVVNLLDRLLYKGVLPRYAFPTDVVSFHVFDSDRSTPFRPIFRYAPGQGLPAALSQYAPGKEVWIDGKLWNSGALYSPMQSDLFNAWQSKRLYFECSICHYAKTEDHGSATRGEVRDCPACGGSATFGEAKNWMRPPGFAHPQFIPVGTSPDDQPGRSYATRAKLVAPGPAIQSSWRPVSKRLRQYYHRTHLLVSNSGPRQEGYSYCTRCGLIEPTAQIVGRVSAPHPKPFPDRRHQDCPDAMSTRGLVLGTDFVTDVVLVSVAVDPPLTLRPNYLATTVALRTLCEALTIASARGLEVELNELQAEFRPALTPLGSNGLEAEIYIYDTLAGGAGFARRIADIGIAVFNQALLLLENCPAECDRSCYRCLRSFKNRFEHELLDRHLGASLLRYLIRDEEPVLSKMRLEQATDKLFADLCRHGLPDVQFLRRAEVDIPGLGNIEAPILAITPSKRLVVGLHDPLMPDHASDPKLRDAAEFGAAVPVLLVDEIVVARNLPHASGQVIEAIT